VAPLAIIPTVSPAHTAGEIPVMDMDTVGVGLIVTTTDFGALGQPTVVPVTV